MGSVFDTAFTPGDPLGEFDPRKVLPRLYNSTLGDKGGQPQQRANLDQAGGASNDFANYNQNQIMGLGDQSQQQRDYLRRLQTGQDSLSAEQLRQSLGQNLAAQRSMAAGASPQNAAMAARTGAMQMGKLGSGLAGQQATAGIQEREAASRALAANLGQQTQANMQGALQGRSNAISAYGGGQIDPSWVDKYSKPVGDTFAALAKSDRRAKADIEDGDAKASKMLAGLKAYSYRYKDEKDGKGTQFGPMAQDMERAGLGHAVIDTPDGKVVHGAKAALSGLALTAALARRVAKLEGGGK